jgi:hypothetical protein
MYPVTHALVAERTIVCTGGGTTSSLEERIDTIICDSRPSTWAMRPISRNQDTVVRAGGKHPGAQVVGPTASGRWWFVPGTAHAPSSYVSHVLIVLVETWIIVDILTPVLFFFVVCCRLASADSD